MTSATAPKAAPSSHSSQSPDLSPDQSALEVISGLSPVTGMRTIQIGEREYTLRELSPLNTLLLTKLVIDEANTLGKAGLLDASKWAGLGGPDGQGTDYTNLLLMIAPVWEQVPELIGKALALILSAERPNDGEYILKHMTNTQLFDVFDAFMETNSVGDIVERFFRSRRKMAEVIAEVTSKRAPTS